ncbi:MULTISPECIES: hypothetical protein [unclassified Leucobacter]
MAEEQDPEPWRIPTGLGAPQGLRPSPGIAPPGGLPEPPLSDWTGYEPADAADALAADAAEQVHEALGVDDVPAAPEPSAEAPTEPAAPPVQPVQPAPVPAAPAAPPVQPPAAAAPVPPSTAPPALTAPPVPTAPSVLPAPVAATPVSAPSATATHGPAPARARPPEGGPKPAATANPMKIVGWVGIGVLVIGAMSLIGSLTNDDGDPGADDSYTAIGADTPEGAVQEYLEALRDGDTVRAAELLSSPDPGVFEHPPLDPSEHPESRIDDVEADTTVQEGDSGSVSVRYTMGGETVSTAMQVERTGDGWFITEGGTVFPEGQVLAGFPTTLNGEPIGGATPALMPGAYELGFETSDFSLPDDERTIVIRLSDAEVLSRIEATPQLTEAGTRRFTEALRSELDDCLAAGTPTTNCGMDVPEEDLPDGYAFEGELTRSLSQGFEAVLTAHPPDLERVDGRLTGKIVLPAEFSANIELSIRSTADGTVRDGHLRDPVSSLRPSAYLAPGPVQLDWTEPDAA